MIRESEIKADQKEKLHNSEEAVLLMYQVVAYAVVSYILGLCLESIN